MRRFGAAFLLLLLLLPAVHGQSGAGAQELNPRRLNVLLYHPYPDPQGDPWGIPDPDGNGSRGYMESRYGAYVFPYTVIDGLDRDEGATDAAATYDLYRRALEERLDHDAPVRLLLIAVANNRSLDVKVQVQAKQDLRTQDLRLRLVLFEDEVPFHDANGPKTERFVVRAMQHEVPLALHGKDPWDLNATFLVAGAVNMDHVGVVASLHNRDGASPEFSPDEVLQSATWIHGQVGPTIQVQRGVLIEMESATWCTACIYGDAAIDRLSNEYGLQSAAFLASAHGYFRGLQTLPASVALGLGACVAAMVVVGRRRGWL